MQRLIEFRSGAGLPLQKFAKVQLAFLIKVPYEPGATLSKRFAIGSTAPEFITMSLILGPSPAMLPMPQIAYSITSGCGEYSKTINFSIAPFYISTFTCSYVPLATFVKHQAASN